MRRDVGPVVDHHVESSAGRRNKCVEELSGALVALVQRTRHTRANGGARVRVGEAIPRPRARGLEVPVPDPVDVRRVRQVELPRLHRPALLDTDLDEPDRLFAERLEEWHVEPRVAMVERLVRARVLQELVQQRLVRRRSRFPRKAAAAGRVRGLDPTHAEHASLAEERRQACPRGYQKTHRRRAVDIRVRNRGPGSAVLGVARAVARSSSSMVSAPRSSNF